jgi:transcriptional repressor NrdR
MRCPVCSVDDSKVVDSRAAEDGAAIRRRRECLVCHHRFTTYERVEEVPVVVVKRSGGREPFDRTKIIRGVRLAATGRPVSPAQLEQLAEDVEDAMRAAGGEVSTEQVGLAVLEHLRDLDHVAYLRFASVYKDFDDPADFQREAKLLKATAPKS